MDRSISTELGYLVIKARIERGEVSNPRQERIVYHPIQKLWEQKVEERDEIDPVEAVRR